MLNLFYKSYLERLFHLVSMDCSQQGIAVIEMQLCDEDSRILVEYSYFLNVERSNLHFLLKLEVGT